jgi:predicted dehydrogenase
MLDVPLRVALIGYGHAGSVFHAPLIASTPGLCLAAIVTASSERASQARNAFPRAQIVPSAEMIWQAAREYHLAVVATPNRTHVELSLAAIAAGLPVVVDKPVAATQTDARRLIDAARCAGKLLTVFHNARWSIPFLTARRVIASGVLGPIASYEARLERFRPVPRPGAWRERGDPREAGGLLYDLGSHLIDQALQLFGPPTEVYAELEQRRPGTQVDDDSFVSLRFGSGVRGRLWMSYVARLPGPALRVSGLRGTYVKLDGDPQEDALQSEVRPDDASWGVETRDHWGRLSTDVDGLHVDGPLESVRGGYDQFYCQLVNALRAGGPPPVDAEDAVLVLRVIEAAQRSARSRTVVHCAVGSAQN